MHKEDRCAPARRRRLLQIVGLILLAAGTSWMLLVAGVSPAGVPPEAVRADRLTSGTVASMDSPALRYSDGWVVAATGADPREPDDPWTTPSGTITFTYQGHNLHLNVATGDYWGYLYVTVDDEPVTDLPTIRGNTDSRGMAAGYKPLYAPGGQSPKDPGAKWMTIHRAADPGPHAVRLEVWRSWDQMPVRGVAIDAMPPAATPPWPGVLFLVAGTLCLLVATAVAAQTGPQHKEAPRLTIALRTAPAAALTRIGPNVIPAFATLGALLAVGGTWTLRWWLALAGVGLLALAGMVRPVLWLSALMAALPFYFAVTIPLLPGRQFSIVDVGVLGAVILLIVHRLLFAPPRRARHPSLVETLALLLAAWALISASGAAVTKAAFYEWRTVFLYGALILPAITYALHWSSAPDRDRALLVGAWLGGATIMAAIALGQFSTGAMTIAAEGVLRVRGLYGSPNNLALYLERTLAVTLALGLFMPHPHVRWVLMSGALIQGAALVLTFSKGALLLALPTMGLVLWLGGLQLLRAQRRSTAALWGLAASAAIMVVMLVPFFGTARFQRIFDFSQGTSFLRLQLWRSSWQMALDHAWLGVGPDNFLYSYRSNYILPEAWREPNLNHAHNWFLDWWTRLGLPGLALGLAYWTSGVITIWRGWQQTTGTGQVLLLGLLASVAAALAHGLIDVSYALPDLMLVWGLVFALSLNLAEQSTEDRARLTGRSRGSSRPG